jgi:hypothetical protein
VLSITVHARGLQLDDALNLSSFASSINEPFPAAAPSGAVLTSPNPGEYGPYIIVGVNDSVTNWVLSAMGSGAYKHLQEMTFGNDQ